jgi:hypothetical protein
VKKRHYEVALGSAAEVGAALDAALGLGCRMKRR